MIALSCQPLVFGLSPCIQIVTVCLLVGVSRTPPPFLGKLSNVEFCEVRGAICKLPPSPGLCAYIYISTHIYTHIYICGGSMALYILEEEDSRVFILSKLTLGFVVPN